MSGFKILYLTASVAIVAALWTFIPEESADPQVWALGLKVRMIGFAVVCLAAFYFFFFRRGKGSR
jgi:energy-converting hydrogenase Eha subunit E